MFFCIFLITTKSHVQQTSIYNQFSSNRQKNPDRSSHLWYCSEKFPCGQKHIFAPGCLCKGDVCKTVDRSPRTANELNFDFSYSEFLIHGGFVFVKFSVSWEKQFQNQWHHQNVKSFGSSRNLRDRPAGGTWLHKFIGLHNQEGVCTGWAVLIGLNVRPFLRTVSSSINTSMMLPVRKTLQRLVRKRDVHDLSH